MTTSIAALERKAARLLDQVDDRRQPRTRVFIREHGADLTPEQRATIGPHDRVVIREYPQGWLLV